MLPNMTPAPSNHKWQSASKQTRLCTSQYDAPDPAFTAPVHSYLRQHGRGNEHVLRHIKLSYEYWRHFVHGCNIRRGWIDDKIQGFRTNPEYNHEHSWRFDRYSEMLNILSAARKAGRIRHTRSRQLLSKSQRREVRKLQANIMLQRWLHGESESSPEILRSLDDTIEQLLDRVRIDEKGNLKLKAPRLADSRMMWTSMENPQLHKWAPAEVYSRVMCSYEENSAVLHVPEQGDETFNAMMGSHLVEYARRIERDRVAAVQQGDHCRLPYGERMLA